MLEKFRYSHQWRIGFFFFLLLCPFLINAQVFDLEQERGELKSIKPGEVHEYRIELSEKELVFVRFEQAGSDIAIGVFGPSGEKIEEFDGNNGKNGPELVHVIPDRAGVYSLRTQPLEEQKKIGNYKVRIDQRIEKAESLEEELGQLIQYWGDQGYLPGFATVLLTSDEILFQKAYGFSNLKEKIPYSLESIQNIGSVSKTLIGISLMIAEEDGKLGLEDDINQYLPFKVLNPYFPDKPITIKQLATHTSSIGEMEAYERSYILHEAFTYQKGEISKGEFEEMQFYAKNETMEMGAFLEAILSVKGRYYKKKNFLKQLPASKYAYSNAGATLAAYIIELLYEMPYHEFTKTRILDKLHMKDSGWMYNELDKEKLSNRHFFNQKVIPPYSLITYPDGGLMTHAHDLSKYLQFLMKGYYGKSKLISSQSFQKMMKPYLSEEQYPRKQRNYGIFWEFWGKDMGHNGGDPGAVCFIRFNKETGVGRMIMTNIIPAHPMANKAFSTIWKFLEIYGEKMKLR